MQNKGNQMTSSLLICYLGCPRNLTNLYPDNGLASLAGCLIKNGHKTKILDYGTVDTRRLMSPGIIRGWLKKVYTKRGKIWARTQLFLIEKVLAIFRKCFENKTAKDILNFHPELYPELEEFAKVREEARKLKRIKKAKERSSVEGICEECGETDFLYRIHGMLVCESCKNSI